MRKQHTKFQKIEKLKKNEQIYAWNISPKCKNLSKINVFSCKLKIADVFHLRLLLYVSARALERCKHNLKIVYGTYVM